VRPAARRTHTAPRTRYTQWTQNTLLTSTVLLALGWLNLIVGEILTIVVAVNGGGAVALLWVVLALAGSAVPFCLGSLARVIVYRYQLEDAGRTR
jgi:heme A synthase